MPFVFFFFLYPSGPSIIITSWSSGAMSVQPDLAERLYKFLSSGDWVIFLNSDHKQQCKLYTWNHAMKFPPCHFSCLPLLSDYQLKFYRKANWVQKIFLTKVINFHRTIKFEEILEKILPTKEGNQERRGKILSWTFIYASLFNSLPPLEVNIMTWLDRCGNWGSGVRDLSENTIVCLTPETTPSSRLRDFQ